MRTLLISGELISGDLAYRLQEEGCEVKLFVEHPLQADCQKGFVERVSDWKKEIEWVGRDGLIVFDDVGYGREQDTLRKEGYQVFGGSEGGDRLEKDREYGQEIFRGIGLDVEPTLNFSTPREAAEHVKKNPACYVVKQNTHQSALNYVGELENGKDTLSLLEQYEVRHLKNISLQKKIEGVEVSVARLFNGTDWVGPTEISFEHKALFNGEIGPKTGEMGSLMFYDASPESPLFKKILDPLKPQLVALGYRGDIAVNSLVKEERVSPIEFTARIGCPIVHLQGDMHLTPWKEILMDVAKGEGGDFQSREGYGIVLTLGLPPFPYEGMNPEYSSAGIEIFFRNGLDSSERKRVHFEGVRRDAKSSPERFFVTESIGYSVFVTGCAPTVQGARQSALDLAKKVIIPKIFYRTDIGERYLEKDEVLLKSWGWL